MPSFSDLFSEHRLVLLDGGLGTSLEKNASIPIAGTPLWSANGIIDEPGAIIEAHLAFVNAGARNIQTATYQSSFRRFAELGYSKEEAVAIMRHGVKLAFEAKSRHFSPTEIKICLSLGPFGASLTPTQEFKGFYPVPYGPKAYSDSEAGGNTNAFHSANDEEIAIEALAVFHYDRLRVFAEDSEIWDMVDIVAFETVPLRREVKAIRRAVGKLEKEMASSSWSLKPWWISCVFPDGRLPERDEDNQAITIGEVTKTALALDDGRESGPLALGINCTGVEHLHSLVHEMTQSLTDILSPGRPEPWLVLYPNGGAFDAASGKWTDQTDSKAWASKVVEVVNTARVDKSWAGIIVGGCCNVGPVEIKTLREALQDQDSNH